MCYYRLVVNYDSDNNLTTIFDKFKSINKLSSDTDEFARKIKVLKDAGAENGLQVNSLIKQYKHLDESVITAGQSFLKGNIDLDTFSDICTKATSSTAKFTAALKSMAANIAISVAINVLISAVSNLIKVGDEIRKQAQELGETFNNTKSDIADYKKEVESLYEVINDNSSSISEVTDARKQLLTVQDEMIDKYGTEQSSIDAITRAIKGET